MAEREIVLDEPVMDGQSVALQHAVERAERAEAELAKLKRGDAAKQSAETRDDATQTHLAEPGSMDRSKQPPAPAPAGHAAREPEMHGLDALRQDSMTSPLLDSLAAGKDIGHYGRLVFAMIARHFLSDDEVIAELTKDEDFSVDQAVAMLRQVEGHDYSPPRRERIMEWQAEQEFLIVPEPNDPDCGNVYRSLRFPTETYHHIEHYQEEKASAA